VFADHHLDTRKRVIKAFPGGPGHTVVLVGLAVQVSAVQVGLAAAVIPPSAYQQLGAMVLFGVVVVSVFSTELHPDVVRK